MGYTLTESGEVLTETQEGRIGHDCAECAAVRAALDVAMTTLEQIATTPRNKGARRNAYSTLAFLRTQLKTPKLDVASCTGEQPDGTVKAWNAQASSSVHYYARPAMSIEAALQWVEKNCSDAETLDRLRSRRVAKTLADEVMRRFGIGGELIAARRERDELVSALKEIAHHHDKQRLLFDEVGDYDSRRYHEDRRNVALMLLTPNV